MSIEEYLTEKRAKEIFVEKEVFNKALDKKVDKGTIMWGVGIMVGIISSVIIASTAFTYSQLAKVEANVKENNGNIVEVQTDVSWIKTEINKWEVDTK